MDYDTKGKKRKHRSSSNSSESQFNPQNTLSESQSIPPPQHYPSISQPMSQMSLASILNSNEQPTSIPPPQHYSSIPQPMPQMSLAPAPTLPSNEQPTQSSAAPGPSKQKMSLASILNSNEQPTSIPPPLSTWNQLIRPRPTKGDSQYRTVGDAIDNYKPKKQLDRSKEQIREELKKLNRLIKDQKLKREQLRQKVEDEGNTHDEINKNTYRNWLNPNTTDRHLPSSDTWNQYRSRPMPDNSYPTIGDAIDNYKPKKQLDRSKEQIREELKKLNRLIKDQKLNREQLRQKVEDEGNTHDEINENTYQRWLAPNTIDRRLPSSDTWNQYRSRPMPDNSSPTIGDAIDNYEPKKQLTRSKEQIREELKKLNRLIKDQKLKREQLRQKVEDEGNTHDEINKKTFETWLAPNTIDKNLPSSDTWNQYRSRPMPDNSSPTIGDAIDNYEPNQSQSQQSAPPSQPQPGPSSAVGNEPTDTGSPFDDEELYGP